ncbi:MAG TPA: energy transducer TonB [Bryobacteraceae bacterium]|nr:energy transducer TonB [Bryobacteraceae bacterium]
MPMYRQVAIGRLCASPFPFWEQPQIRGVYLDVFEQSVLPRERSKRPWSFAASLTAEIVVIGALILIPLAYNERLPEFHWRGVSVGAPLKPAQPIPAATHALRSASRLSALRVFVPVFEYSSGPRAETSGPTILDVPTGDMVVGGQASGPSGATDILSTGPMPPPPPPPMVRDPPAQLRNSVPIRVGGDVQSANLIRKVIPEYPPLAKSARISGVVRLIGMIARDGTIQHLQLVSGHPLLAHAAMDAVRQWIYRPTLLNGEQVEVIAPIEVYFTLGQ